MDRYWVEYLDGTVKSELVMADTLPHALHLFQEAHPALPGLAIISIVSALGKGEA